MYHIGQQVVYGIHGICLILDVEKRKIDRKLVEYFVLEPLQQPGARFYIPTGNQAALNKLRPVITKEQLDSIIRDCVSEDDAWIADENQRKQRYRELIASANCADLIAMVRALHRHRREQAELGKKFHLCDENFLRDAERLLRGELSTVLRIEEAEVAHYMISIFGNE